VEQLQLYAENREFLTKGNNKQLRASGRLPAVIYGKGIEAKEIAVDYKELNKIIVTHGSNALITLKTPEGDQIVMVREMQKHPIKGELLHVDFMKVALDVKIEALVPIMLKGDSEGVRQGGTLQNQLRELNIKALPAQIPENIEVDISGLRIGESIKVSDVKIAEDYEIINDGDEIIASVLAPKAVEEAEEAPEEGAKEPEAVTNKEHEE
jgi:large subunit ribosomal protein L25